MGTRSQKRTVGASLWIIFKATKTRFGMRKSALQAGHLTSSLPSSNFSKRFASGVIVIWVWQPLHGTSIEPAQRSAPVKLISFLSSGIATPICYPSPDRSGTIPAQQRANARLVVGPKHTLDWQSNAYHPRQEDLHVSEGCHFSGKPSRRTTGGVVHILT